MAVILIIDDEEYVRESLSERVLRLGHEALVAATLQEGLQLVEHNTIDLILLDVSLPDGNGLESLPFIKGRLSAPEVIIITAVGSASGAALAIENGAWDYITKPFTREEITLHINRAVEYRQAKAKRTTTVVLDTNNLIGKSNTFKQCLQQVAQSAANDANVLILGETGTGKELFAKAVHENSHAVTGSYVVVDCASMPENLIESVLLGHTKGAFTGAENASEGLVKQADGGTLFLDEVGELPLAMQTSLLRVLQEKKFRPVGSSQETKSDFRLISATNRNLEEMVKEGKFRRDLFHRLQSLSITLPPLRERVEDIVLLAQHYTIRLCKKHAIPSKTLIPETLEALNSYLWPGNVRELINALEKGILTEPDLPVLYPMFLPDSIRIAFAEKQLKSTEPTGSQNKKTVTLPDSMYSSLSSEGSFPELKHFREAGVSELEKLYLKSLLNLTGWDLDKAASISALSKSRIYSLTKKYGLKKN